MRLQTVKLLLALFGVIVFLLGNRSDIGLARWGGIALVTVAWLLRFVRRSASVQRPPTFPSERH